jgi:hypothetical protein
MLRKTRQHKRVLWGLNDFENTRIGIALTGPAWNGSARGREVESLYVEAIGYAQMDFHLESIFASRGSLSTRSPQKDRMAQVPIAVHCCLMRSQAGRLPPRVRTSTQEPFSFLPCNELAA